MSYENVYNLLSELKLTGIANSLDVISQKWSSNSGDIYEFLEMLLFEEKKERKEKHIDTLLKCQVRNKSAPPGRCKSAPVI